MIETLCFLIVLLKISLSKVCVNSATIHVEGFKQVCVSLHWNRKPNVLIVRPLRRVRQQGLSTYLCSILFLSDTKSTPLQLGKTL